jgi:hypothetical protein
MERRKRMIQACEDERVCCVNCNGLVLLTCRKMTLEIALPRLGLSS